MEKGLRKRSEWNAHGGTWGAGEMGVRSPDNSFTLVAYLQCFITKSGGGGQEVRARRDPKGKRGAGGAGGGGCQGKEEELFWPTPGPLKCRIAKGPLTWGQAIIAKMEHM